jgi:hypothetical protein
MSETLKPGTRCECRSERHAMQYVNPLAHRNGCNMEAVRMVTVSWDGGKDCLDSDGEVRQYGVTHVRQVPMCSSCAAWHEAQRKAGAR